MTWQNGPSLQDVADLAGVSRPTASNALNNKGRVSPATVEAVKKAALELNYQVNLGAKFLRQAKSGSVGLYLGESITTVDFYMKLAFGVVEAARDEDYSVVLLSPHDSQLNLSGVAVDGYILIDIENDDPIAREILEGSRPVINMEQVHPGMPSPAGMVCFEHKAAIRKLLNHLLSQDSHSIALLSLNMDTAWVREVESAYIEWSNEHNMKPNIVHSSGARTPVEYAEIAASLLTDQPEIDAIIAIPDDSGPGALIGAQQVGRTIGHDILIAAYLDSAMSHYTVPPLTALDFNPREFGKRLFELFFEVINSEKSDELKTHVVPDSDISLQVRQSSLRTV